jgi:hypothetical protein
MYTEPVLIYAEALSERWGKRPILDPRWGLERMIAAMAKISDEHIGPFPDAGRGGARRSGMSRIVVDAPFMSNGSANRAGGSGSRRGCR